MNPYPNVFYMNVFGWSVLNVRKYDVGEMSCACQCTWLEDTHITHAHRATTLPIHYGMLSFFLFCNVIFLISSLLVLSLFVTRRLPFRYMSFEAPFCWFITHVSVQCNNVRIGSMAFIFLYTWILFAWYFKQQLWILLNQDILVLE